MAPQIREPEFEGKTVAQWTEQLKWPDTGAKISALLAIRSLAPGGTSALTAVVAATKDKQWVVRARAAQCLGAFGPEAHEAVPSLKRLLRDRENFHVNQEAILALGAIGPEARVAAAEIKSFLWNREFHSAPQAAEALCRIGGEGPEHVLKRIDASLEDGDSSTASSLMPALRFAGPGAIPHLVRWLEPAVERDTGLACAIVKVLGSFGKEAHAALPQLKNLSSPLKAYLLLCIDPAQVDAAQVAPQLIGDLGKARYQEFDAAADALVLLGKPGLKAVLDTLKNGKPYQDVWLFDALSKFGPEAAEAVPLLLEKLKVAQDEPRAACIKALGRIGAPAKGAVSALMAEVCNPKSPCRARAATALGGIGKDAREAIPSLTAALDSDDELLKQEARRALSRIRQANPGSTAVRDEDF
ncbi:MAG: HEAT repeat domain-containing protein [Planctomycetota bacterium]|nr:HEAT repeat domain-containing protein [Planctomycetota bacterium]